MRPRWVEFEFGDAHEVVGCGSEPHPRAVARLSHIAQLAPATHGLQPAEDLTVTLGTVANRAGRASGLLDFDWL